MTLSLSCMWDKTGICFSSRWDRDFMSCQPPPWSPYSGMRLQRNLGTQGRYLCTEWMLWLWTQITDVWVDFMGVGLFVFWESWGASSFVTLGVLVDSITQTHRHVQRHTNMYVHYHIMYIQADMYTSQHVSVLISALTHTHIWSRTGTDATHTPIHVHTPWPAQCMESLKYETFKADPYGSSYQQTLWPGNSRFWHLQKNKNLKYHR